MVVAVVVEVVDVPAGNAAEHGPGLGETPATDLLGGLGNPPVGLDVVEEVELGGHGSSMRMTPDSDFGDRPPTLAAMVPDRSHAGFDRAAAERVLRRAIELHDAQWDDRDDLRLDEAVLREAAEELGVDPATVRQAAAEERLGVLVGSPHRGDRLVGPGRLVATRIVELGADAALERADLWLRKVDAFRRRRRGARSAEYSRRGDVVAAVQRGARTLAGHEGVSALRTLTVMVEPVGDHHAVLALVADLERQRRQTVVAGGSVAAGGTAAASSAALIATPYWWLAVPGSLAAGAGLLRARARGLGDVQTSLDGLADWIASDQPLPSVLGGVGPSAVGRQLADTVGAGAVRSARSAQRAATDARARRSPPGPATTGPRGGGR